ncbi:MAG TPA: aminotransferase class III-fold pyridoxal phosphate-dependent enzyme [Vicinamibacterales bacterium]|nr:aminotransferase class III-fold pyridoxal phosphate-dependent enzyme [Vicinamibacterales bacterium]
MTPTGPAVGQAEPRRAERAAMTGEEIVALAKKHTLFEWSIQGAVDPIPVARAKGVYFWTPDGKRFLDFNSQLMCVNIGHGDPRVVKAIQDQAAQLPYASPFMATEVRARLGAKLAEICPGDIDAFFFTNGGAEANENAIKIARWITGRQKIVAFYRSYHGGTAGAISATGDPRRWTEPSVPGFVHVLNPYHGLERGWTTAEHALDYLEEVIQLEGPATIAGFILEPVVGSNGVLVPPEGFVAGVRALCDKYGILMIADEVMSGFGRTGTWFAVNHWNVVPDLLTMAKGLTSAYVPLGAVGMRRAWADTFKDRMFSSGLTYNSHPLACAAALATIGVYEEDRLIDNARSMGEILKQLLADMEARHPSVGAVRSLGLFGIVELTRNRATREPLAPFGSSSPEMAALSKFFRDEGLFTFFRWHNFFTNPPLCITDAQLREGFDIIDRGLTAVDKAL